MRRVAAMALVALMGIGVSGCATHGQPNDLGFLADEAEAIETLRVVGLIGLSIGAARGRYASIAPPSYSSPEPVYAPGITAAHEDAFTQTGNRRPRSNLGNIDNPFNHTKARNRSGGFRNSWRIRSGNCTPQPNCILRAR